MHRDATDRRYATGMRRRLDGKQLVADLHGRGLTPDDVADIVCQLFCIPRGAARLFVDSHPDWACEASAAGPRWTDRDIPLIQERRVMPAGG